MTHLKGKFKIYGNIKYQGEYGDTHPLLLRIYLVKQLWKTGFFFPNRADHDVCALCTTQQPHSKVYTQEYVHVYNRRHAWGYS